MKNGWQTCGNKYAQFDDAPLAPCEPHSKVEVFTANFPFGVSLDGTQKRLATVADDD